MSIKKKQHCEACEEPGYFTSGVPGVLAHVVKGSIESSVERCDVCERYETDADARNALHEVLVKNMNREPARGVSKALGIKPGSRVRIPAAEIEFVAGSNTIWVHSPLGVTTLRIKCTGKITADRCPTSPTSHADLIVNGDVHVCVSKDGIVE